MSTQIQCLERVGSQEHLSYDDYPPIYQDPACQLLFCWSGSSGLRVGDDDALAVIVHTYVPRLELQQT
jgi:hypothetical protein